jgi:hypothetical protein
VNEAERILVNHLEGLGFAHVAKRLRLVIGHKEAHDYFTELLVGSRDGRAGFPPKAFEVLIALYRIQDFKVIELDTKGL